MKSGLILTLSIWRVLRKHMDDNFDIGSVYKYTDLVHVHTYGYHGGWESVTGSMAPLSYSKSEDGPINQYSNVKNTWRYLRQKGAHPNKTIIVVPFKGSAFVLKDLNQTGKYAPTVPNSKEKLTWKYDHPLYHELCVEIQKDNGWVMEWDSTGMVPYMYKGNQWISYENTDSVEEKATFVVREKLAGLAVDNIGRDDVKGVCSNVTFPLLKALHNIRSGAETTALKMVIMACSLAMLYLF